MTATGVVLAGGSSTRFGDGDKALARVGGRTAIERVAGAVRSGTGRRPVVAVRDRDDRDAYRDLVDAAFALDADGFEGPLAGVVGALEAVSTGWLFVCGCDMPLLSADAVRWMAGRLPDDGDGADALAVRHPDGTLDPMHALYRRSAVESAVESLPPSGGVRALLSALRADAVPVEAAPAGVDLRASLWNVNTRGDLERVRERIGER